jgi:hypothetical protein
MTIFHATGYQQVLDAMRRASAADAKQGQSAGHDPGAGPPGECALEVFWAGH